MSSAPLVSVCIVAAHGARALEACLAGLRGQQGAPSFEVLVADNGERAAAPVARAAFPAARVLSTGRRLPGAARNPLVAAAHGELLLFLDDDVVPPSRLLARLAVLAAAHPTVSVFGGPNVTPPESSRFQFVQGAVLSSVMGAGPVRRRYGARRAGRADERWFTLCNLAVRRGVMRDFPDDLLCAEENAVLAELEAHGEFMAYDPELFVFHERRADWRSFARQMHKYGRGRGELVVRAPRTARASFLAPSALLLYLLALTPGVLLLGHPALLGGPAALYGAGVLVNAAVVAASLRRPTVLPVAAALVALLHASYGSGVLRGIARGFIPGSHRAPASLSPRGSDLPGDEAHGDDGDDARAVALLVSDG